MEKLIKTLRRILRPEFPGAEIDLEQAVPGSKVGGFVIWDGFQGIDHVDRQQLIWKLLRDKLSREDQLKITALFAMTPEEMTAVREG